MTHPAADSGKVIPLHTTYTAEAKEICKRYNVGHIAQGLDTHWLLNSIKNWVALGYDGPRGPSEAHNLKSALEHTQVIDEELQKDFLASQNSWSILNQKP